MQFLLDELQFNTFMLYYGDLLGHEQKAEIIRRQIEIIEHLNQLQQQGVEVFGDDDDDDSTIIEEDSMELEDPGPTINENDNMHIC